MKKAGAVPKLERVSEEYWALAGVNLHQVQGKPVTIVGFELLDLFVHKRPENNNSGNAWAVSEGICGKEVKTGRTRALALSAAVERLGSTTPKEVSEVVARWVRDLGPTPRYSLPAGLTKDAVTANMCLTGETTGNSKPQEKQQVPRTKAPSRAEVAKEQRASSGALEVVEAQPRQQDLEVMPDANMMSAEDAIRIEDNIGKSSSNIFKWIMQLFRGKAHIARGFPTWEAYYSDVTGKSRASAYRAVDEAIQKERLIEMGVPARFNQKQIAALKPVIEKGKGAIEQTLKEAKKLVTSKGANEKVKSEFHTTGMLPASAIRKAVEKIVPPAPSADKPVDVTGAIKAQIDAAAPPTIDTEAPSGPGEPANAEEWAMSGTTDFVDCAWLVAETPDGPMGFLKVVMTGGASVLIPYRAMYEAYAAWPQEFLTIDGDIMPPEVLGEEEAEYPDVEDVDLATAEE